MKRMFILVAVVALVAGSLFADEAILIDFSRLAADISVNDQDGNLNQNRQTLVDYSNAAGGSFTAEQKLLLKSSLAADNWEVALASSSRTTENQRFSYAKAAASAQWGSVLGVRVHFPVEPHNAWAIIKPPFEIPAYEYGIVNDDGTIEASDTGITGTSRFERQSDDPADPAYGLVKNVGTIKSVAVNVYGLNFPHHLSAILIDTDGNQKIISLGYLNFDGWAQLEWNNPAYVQEVRNRELRLYPLYPTATPFVKFGGFLVQRDAGAVGGDFLAYFKDVKIIYDKAVLDTGADINNEDEWGIIQEREGDKDKFQMQRFGQNQVLQYLDNQKKATESAFTPTPLNNE